MNSELISVVVPVYKVEKYLHRCVDSILNQTYKNFELILVDDGSPDKCPFICDEYEKIDSRVHVIHKKNGGLSDARNEGTKIAKGEFITYIDSDDCVSGDYLEYLRSLILSDEVDISCCDFFRSEKMTPHFLHQSSGYTILTGREACNRLYSDEYVRTVVAWGKLYRSSIAKRYEFPYGRIHEDEATTYLMLYAARKVVFGDKRCYAYYINPKGIMGSRINALNMDIIEAYVERTLFFKEKGEYLLMKETVNRLFVYITLYQKKIKESELWREYKRKFYKREYLSLKNYIKFCVLWNSKLVNCIYKKKHLL